jgi:histidinol-phosphatase
VDQLGDAQLLTAGLRPMEAAGHAEAMRHLRTVAWRDRGFGEFWAYMLVAEGAADVMLEVGVNRWDLAAPAIIVREAGGRLTDFAGAPSYDGPESLATNGRLHDTVLAVLGSA